MKDQAVSLESLLITDELGKRPSRSPDLEAEGRALVAIAQHMAESPRTALEKLVEVARDVLRAGSVGVSFVSKDKSGFFCPAIAGAWKAHIDCVRQTWGPCRLVLASNEVLLFQRPERYYTHLMPISPPIEELLLAPFHVEGRAMGTIWAMAHDPVRTFDAEDARLLQDLGRFTAVAHAAWLQSDARERHSRLLRDSNEALLLASVHQRGLAQQARKAEAASERRYRILVEQVKDYAIFMTDAQGRATSWNEGVQRILGFDEADFIGRDIVPLTFTPEDLRAGVPQRELEEARATGTASSERWMKRKDGTSFFGSGVTTTLYDGGTILGFVRVLRDHTERKQAEQRGVLLLADLVRSNDELQQFAYLASHDLREPLRTIASFLALLARRFEGKLGAEADEYIAFAVDAARRMDELIISMLAYTQVAGEVHEVVAMDLDELLKRVLKNLQGVITDAKAEITHDPLPIVQGDSRLEQVVQNLISNAIKFRGPEAPRVHVSAVREGHQWRFAVKDNGIGISPEAVSRLFRIVHRLHGDKEYPGTGIGLAICKKIIESHGGQIWVESRPGQGSTFYFTIPEVSAAAVRGRQARK